MTLPALGGRRRAVREGGGPSAEDLRVVRALRDGDESAFVALVDAHGGSMLRLATSWVGDRAVAEEVVQEACVGLLGSLDRFEGRASLKTWLFRILVNCARARARKEQRSVAFSSLEGADEDGPTVDPSRFRGAGERWASHWQSAPAAWPQTPEQRALSRETRACIHDAVSALPAAQRQVITLRGIAGMSADEVCNAMEITDTNQRVLLHRARAKVRRALEAYFEGSG